MSTSGDLKTAIDGLCKAFDWEEACVEEKKAMLELRRQYLGWYGVEAPSKPPEATND